MPREVKQKVSTAVVRKKKKNGYVLPESIPLGEILTDLTKNQWKIGPSIGIGGFGEIYSACNAKKPTKKVEDYEYVVKIEPSENGPLFVEMHFYKRNAKQEDLKTFIKAKGLKSLGMPYLLGSGSHEINGKKHRFIVMPRYGQDIWSAFLTNNNKLPEHTIYRLAIQMLDVYEYIHQCTYVHADLKGANILLGFGKTGGSQAYLVDFGLASHYTTKDFKPDPKKMHNGTIEYTSRDAHLGVPTMRGDFEILCYNIIHWSGVTLPWEADKLLTNPGKVQKSKEDFMKTPDASLKKLYEKKNIPESIKQYMKYVTNLQFNESPDYDKCRKIFETGLKTLGKPNSGNLELKFATVSMTNVTTKKRAKSPVPVEIIEESDSDSVVLPSPKEKLIKRSPMKRKPISTPSSISPKKSKIIKTSPSSVGKKETKKKINYSPVVNINKNLNSSATKKYGKTIINDNLTPNATNSKKTYEFNFDLDVSLDANVIVNVNRKKKAKTTKNNDVNGDEKSETPEPRVFIRKLSSRNSNSTTPKQKSK